MSSPVRLVCFDLGWVLVRICNDWQHALKEAGITGPARSLSDDEKGRLFQLVLESEVGRMSLSDFNRAAGELFGLDTDQVSRLSDAYLLGTYPGAIELLDELRSAGLKTACLSNTNANHWRIMCDCDSSSYILTDRFDYQFASHLVGHRKPEDAIYAHVESATGLSGPQILFFDDLSENITAAAARGWLTHLIHRNHDPINQIRNRLSELNILSRQPR